MVTIDDLRRYMAQCGADFSGPLGERWLDHPLGASALGVRAAAIKSYYLHVCTSEGVNAKLRESLATVRLPSKAAKNRSLLGHTMTAQAGNALAPAVPRRNPRLLPDGAIEALLGAATTARDRMIITWLADTGMRVGELCGLRFSDLHLLASADCEERRGPHLHVVLREDNPNRARAKRGTLPVLRAGTSGPGLVVTGGIIRSVSPAMVDTYYEYFLNEYVDVRALAQHDHVLVGLRNKVGAALTTHGVEQMITRVANRVGLKGITPHRFRHTWATALFEASGGNATLVAREGGWASTQTVQSTYAHVSGNARATEALETVWNAMKGKVDL